MIAFDCGSLVATGSTQGTAAAIANDTVSITSTGVGQGAILPGGCYRVLARNSNALGGNNISVYPPSGATIGTALVNVAVPVTPQNSILFIEISATHWAFVSVTG